MSFKKGDRVRHKKNPGRTFTVIQSASIDRVEVEEPSIGQRAWFDAKDLTLEVPDGGDTLDLDFLELDEITRPTIYESTTVHTCEDSEEPMRAADKNFEAWHYCKVCGEWTRKHTP